MAHYALGKYGARNSKCGTSSFDTRCTVPSLVSIQDLLIKRRSHGGLPCLDSWQTKKLTVAGMHVK